MDITNLPFRQAIKPWTIKAILLLLLFMQNFVFGLTGYMIPHVSKDYGIPMDVMIWSVQINAAILVVMIPVFYRLRLYFKPADLIEGAIIIEAILCLLCYWFKYAPFLLMANLLLAICKAVCLLDFISLISAAYPATKHRALFYGLLYTITKVGASIAELTTLPIIHLHWSQLYLVSVVAALISLGACLSVFQNKRLQPKVSLKKIDWISIGLLFSACMCFTFICTFDKRLGGLGSFLIVVNIIAFFLFAGIFTWRQLTVQKPLWNLRVFQAHRQVPLAFVFMILMYSCYGCNHLFNLFAAHQFADSPQQYLLLEWVTVLAYLLFFPGTGILLYKGYSKRMILSTGFICYACACFLIHFTPLGNSGSTYLILAYFLKGAGYGMLLTSLSTFMATNINKAFNKDRLMASIISRYVFGSALFSSLYSNWAPNLSSWTGVLQKTTVIEATLNSTRQILGMVAIAGLFLGLIVVFIKRFDTKEKKTGDNYQII
jgi:DHA2 family multidrug resistance protein